MLVLHGTDDPLVRVEGGRDTAANISGARMVEIAGWGHDMPKELMVRLVDEIGNHCASAEGRAQAAE